MMMTMTMTMMMMMMMMTRMMMMMMMMMFLTRNVTVFCSMNLFFALHSVLELKGL